MGRKREKEEEDKVHTAAIAETGHRHAHISPCAIVGKEHVFAYVYFLQIY